MKKSRGLPPISGWLAGPFRALRVRGSRRLKSGIYAAVLLLGGLAWIPQKLPALESDGRWALLLVGSSGDQDLKKAYLQEMVDLHSILVNSLGFRQEQIIGMFEDSGGAAGIIQHRSTRADFQAVCHDLAGRVRPEDLVFVFIEGHGAYDGNTYKLNLPGPDPTAGELAAMLYSIPARQFVVVNATSCSGGSISALSRKGTILMASTKSGMEKNRTHLGRFFIDGLQHNTADYDKNGRVSMMEAFSYAKQQVESFYNNENGIQTEHPLLDDSGDGKGESSPSPENGVGLLARTIFLDKGISPRVSTRIPEQQMLEREAREIEKQIEALKYSKNKMPESEYEKQLEALLLRLAQINAKLPK